MRRRNGHRPSFPTKALARPGDGCRFRRAARSTFARHRRGPDATAASAWTILLLHSFSAIAPSKLQCAMASATGCSSQESVRHSASIKAFIIAGKRLDNYVPGATSSAHDQEENAQSPASCRCGNSATAAKDHDIGLSEQGEKNTGGFGQARAGLCTFGWRTPGLEKAVAGAAWRRQVMQPRAEIGAPGSISRTITTRTRARLSVAELRNHRYAPPCFLSFILGYERRSRRSECVFFVTRINIVMFLAGIFRERWTIAASCGHTCLQAWTLQ